MMPVSRTGPPAGCSESLAATLVPAARPVEAPRPESNGRSEVATSRGRLAQCHNVRENNSHRPLVGERTYDNRPKWRQTWENACTKSAKSLIYKRKHPVVFFA